MTNCAVLFARRTSVYKALGCDVYDEDRDARTFPGGKAVITHPPCRLWGSLRHCSKAPDSERQLAFFALRAVRAWGGVLEHPALSTFWLAAKLPRPGAGADRFGGWTLAVDQYWWGHRARKRTFLYIVGVAPSAVPGFPLVLGEASHTVGLWSGRDKRTCRPSIAKAEFEATPLQFACWLLELAARVRGGGQGRLVQ